MGSDGTIAAEEEVFLPNGRRTNGLKEKNGNGDDGGVPPVLDDAGLGDVSRTDDLSADLKDFFFVIPAFINVEVNPEGGGQHGCGKILRMIACLTFRLAEGMIFTDITICVAVCGNGTTHGSGQQAPGLVTVASAHDTVGDRPRLQLP